MPFVIGGGPLSVAVPVSLVLATTVGLAAVPVLGGAPVVVSASADVPPVPVDGFARAASPTAEITVSPNPAHPGETVTLDASASGNGEVACDFDLEGDGTYEVFGDQDCILTHAYSLPGTYEPTVRVRDANQQTDTASATLSVVQNQPPEAAFDYAPAEPAVGEPVTFDASTSSDPDGSIVEYRWDFDDDGAIDATTSDPVVSHAYSEPGTYTVGLEVEDDDGSTDETVDEVVVVRAQSGSPQAHCVASTRSVAPGEPVTLDASNSVNAESVEFDVDGDGTYDRSPEGFRLTVSYDEPGTYTPRARVVGPNGQTAVAECGTVTVEVQNEPPVARFTHDRADPDAATVITFDATTSFDPDGEIVAYRWDFDGDGRVDATTDGPVVTHAYPEVRTYTVILEVEDDDGATDAIANPVELGRDGVPWQSFVPVLVGLIGGLAVCRGLGWLGRFRRPSIAVPAGAGVTAYAAGVFALPAEGGTVEVADVGFEPDLVLLTASNAVVAGDATDQVRGTADGWSYGAVRRTTDGELDQHVVAVADDALEPDAVMAASHGELALHLASADGEGSIGGVKGRIARTDAEGFTFAAEVPGIPNAANSQSTAPADRPVVLYRAFELDSPGDVALGQFATPTEPGLQTIALDVPADHVTLVATDGIGSLDASATVEGGVGISVGEVVGPDDPRQLVTAGAFVPGEVSATAVAASDASAIHLPATSSDGRGGPTRARAIGVGDALDLEYEAVATHPETSTPAAPETGTPADPALVTYVALHTGAAAPALGHFALPSPAAEDDLSVDTGFAPGMVEFTVVDIDELGERTALSSPFAFGRSHGVAVRGADGGVEQHLLSGAVDPDRPLRRLDHAGADVEGLASEASSSAAEQADSTHEVLVADATAAGLAADGAGAAITGRDDVAVTAFRATGFDVRVTDVSTDQRDNEADSDKLVCYKAWPRLDR